MKLANWLERSAATAPDRVALIAGDERLSFGELERRAIDAARRLASLGVEASTRVAVSLPPVADQVVLVHALAKLSAVAVPLDAALPDREHERLLAGAGAELAISDFETVAGAAPADVPLAREHDLESVCCVIHTSGSAGAPKPVELTYGNHLWSALGSAARIGVDPADRWLCTLPLHHVGGLAIVLRSAVYGTAVVLERFEADRVAALIRSEQVTLASLVATTLGRLLEAGADLTKLRCVLLGGGPVRPALLDSALDAGVPIAPTYGMTEAASQVTTLPPGEAHRRPGSAGTPLLPTAVRIDGDGVICVRGPTLAPGAAGADGWLRSGDLGRLDRDGHLYVLGRADHVIVTGGENVSPEEVEQALLEHPEVADAAVTGVDDPEWQRAVVAFVVPRAAGAVTGPQLERELREHCRARLASHKTPKRIAFVERLPRNAQGKLLRSELARVAAERP